METPASMTDAQLRAVLLRLSLQRPAAGPQRRATIVTVMDAVLDEINARRDRVSV